MLIWWWWRRTASKFSPTSAQRQVFSFVNWLSLTRVQAPILFFELICHRTRKFKKNNSCNSKMRIRERWNQLIKLKSLWGFANVLWSYPLLYWMASRCSDPWLRLLRCIRSRDLSVRPGDRTRRWNSSPDHAKTVDRRNTNRRAEICSIACNQRKIVASYQSGRVREPSRGIARQGCSRYRKKCSNCNKTHRSCSEYRNFRLGWRRASWSKSAIPDSGYQLQVPTANNYTLKSYRTRLTAP